MTVEIERRYWMTELPEGLDSAQWCFIRQGYLSIDQNSEVRIRACDGNFTLTVKTGSGLVRQEVEITLSMEDFERLWPLTEGRRLEKRRTEFRRDGTLFHIDQYLQPLDFLLAEVEFSSEAHAEAFNPPDFLGREITEFKSMRDFPDLVASVKAIRSGNKC